MCGRYQSVSNPAKLAEHFAVTDIRVDDHRPRWNVAPTTDVLAIIDHDRSRRLGTLRWGFVPVWAKQLGGRGQPINARLETVATNRMFASSFQRRRCLLPADGFYEWQDRAEGRRKQPFHIADPDGAPLAFAGVWTSWRASEDQPPIASAAIITTAARGVMADIHERMPLILPPGLWDVWLDDDDDAAPHLVDTVTALEPPALVATPISTRINNVRNNGPELLEPGTVDD